MHISQKTRLILTRTAIAAAFIVAGAFTHAQTPATTPKTTPTATAVPTANPPSGNADRTYTLLEPLPCIPTVIEKVDANGNKTTETPVPCPAAPNGKLSTFPTVKLGDFFSYAFNLLIALAAVAAVFMIVWGGFKYVTSVSGMVKADGLQIFSNAIWGLLLVLGAWLILKTVNPKLVAFPTSIPVIELPKRLNTTSPLGLFDQLAKDLADSARADLSNTLASNQAHDKQIASDSTEKAALQAELKTLMTNGFDDSTPEVKDLKARITALDNSIGYEQGAEELDTGVQQIKNVLLDTNPSTIKEFLDKISKVRALEDYYTENLQTLSQYENITKLTEQATYATQVLTLMKDQRLMSDSILYVDADGRPAYKTGNTVKNLVLADINNAISTQQSIQDPDLKRKITDLTKTTSTAFHKAYP